MSPSEKETIILAWPCPWPKYLGLLQRFRDDRLNAQVVSEDEQRKIEWQYAAALDWMLDTKLGGS